MASILINSPGTELHLGIVASVTQDLPGGLAVQSSGCQIGIGLEYSL